MSTTRPVSGGLLHNELCLFLTALRYFTRVPVPEWVGESPEGATRYFPAVGVAVGMTAAMVLWACSLVFPATVATLLSMTVTIVLTGAFHEDGLADTIDGFGGGTTREQVLRIMKDSRIGPFGAIALMLVLLLKFSALVVLPVPLAMAALIAAHGASRWCAVMLVWRMSYARTDASSRAKPALERLTSSDVVIGSTFGLMPLMLCGPRAIAGIIAMLLVLGCLGRWYARRLGGYTGDTLGAAQQFTEVAFYLALLAYQS